MASKRRSLKNLRILFANGRMTYPFFVGGDGISLHTWFSFFHQKGIKCQAVGVIDPKNFPQEESSILKKLNKLNCPYEWSFQETKMKTPTEQTFVLQTHQQLEYKIPYLCIMVKRVDFFQKLKEIIKQNRPHVVFTQLEFSPKIVSEVQELDVPVFFFVHDIGPENKWTFEKIDKAKGLVKIVFNSQFIKEKFKNFNQYIKKHNTVCYPPLKKSDYLTSSNKKFITMINPVEIKGGKIFEKIVKRLPERQFLAIKGWFDPKEDGINLKKYPNVVLWEKQDDMREVYRETKFLLIPSIIEEGFCRVATEAALSGIPAIASQKGGLPEAIRNGGILIKNPRNINSWVRAIKRLDEDKVLYQKFSAEARKHAGKFLVNKSAQRLLEEMQKWIKDY